MIQLSKLAKNYLGEGVSNRVYNSIDFDDRIVVGDSELDLSGFHKVEQDNSKNRRFVNKPNGLWYGIGTDWIDWVRDNMPMWEGDFVYRIGVDEKSILVLRNADSIPAKFLYDYKGKQVPNWIEIAKEYAGVELENYRGTSWDTGWDVSSGCLWDSDAITDFEILQ